MQGQEIDFQDKVIEKTVNIKRKTLLQLPFNIQKIDTKYLQNYKPAKKKDKNSGKNKSINIFFINISNRKQKFSIYQTNKKYYNY